jgi:Flp pilus assembly protein TadG
MISFYSCEKKSDIIIDPTLIAPSISNPLKSKDTVYTVSDAPVVNFVTSVRVQQGGDDAIESVVCSLLDPNGNLIQNFSMSDNGSSPDTTGNNGTFTVTVNYTTTSCLTVGNYSVQYLATSASGLTSNLIVSTVPVYYSNNIAPVVSFVNAPDTVQKPSTGFVAFALRVTGSDPNGSCDIKNVFFRTIRPDGTTNGLQFNMFDDGDLIAHGDSVAGDNRYSLIIQIDSTPATQTGTFQFNFQATDNRGLSSAILNKPLYVKAP